VLTCYRIDTPGPSISRNPPSSIRKKEKEKDIMVRLASSLALLAAAVGPAVAQTFTSCNPLNSTCPDDPALGTSFNQTYSSGSSLDTNLWNLTAGSPQFSDNGAEFQIVSSGDSVTAQTNFYIFWGRIEVWMQAAAGTGIISSLVLLSDDLDEIDWEIMGGNTTSVENNYYGKGNQSERNALYYPCDGPQEGFHNYTVHWTKDVLEWHLDGHMIRSLAPSDAPGGYPQTPSYFKMGIWAGGDPSEPVGVQQWAGGTTDYSKGPFTMIIRNVTITDYTTNATSYSFGDHSGSYESIKVDKQGPSKAATIANAPPPETTEQKWNGLSTGAKIAIIVVPSAVVGILAIVGGFCCIKQRALGRRERAIEDAQWEKENAEMLSYRRQMAAGGFSAASVAGGSVAGTVRSNVSGMQQQGSMRSMASGGSRGPAMPPMPSMPQGYSNIPNSPMSPHSPMGHGGTPVGPQRMF